MTSSPHEIDPEDFGLNEPEDFTEDMEWGSEDDEDLDFNEFEELDGVDDPSSLDGFDEWTEDRPEDAPQVRVAGKLGSRSYVQQLVQALMDAFPDCENLEPVAEEILTDSPHHQTREALRRLLERGYSPHELSVAHLLRQAWNDDPTYGSAGYVHGDAALGWPEAAEISKVFRDVPDYDEVALFLVEQFERYKSDCKTGDQPEFATYLIWMADSEDPATVVAPGVSIHDTLSNWGDRD